MGLKEYQRKRKFTSTPEPKGREGRTSSKRGDLRFVVQMHDAGRLHFDLRLEMGGVFKSWAVPKGPSLNPLDQRLAIFVEDHPLEYGSFEGIIPRGNYGAGTVMIWDEGTYQERGSRSRRESEAAMLRGLERGHLTFLFEGHKLKGEFALIKLKGGSRRFGASDEKAWLLVKKRDGFSSYRREPEENLSVKTGRDIREIAAASEKKGDVWLPKRTRTAPRNAPKTAGKLASALKPTRKVMKSARAEGQGLPPAPRAARAAFPHRLKAMIPVQSKEPLEAKGWLYDPLRGGTRALCEVERGRVKLYSRQLLPFERKYPGVVEALRKVSHDLVLDGEIADHAYRVFDLLYLDGRDLRTQTLVERKRLLKQLKIFGASIELSEDEKSWPRLPREGLREVLARDESSAYHPGVSRAWVQFKVSEKRAATEKKAAAPQAFSNLDKVFWPDDGYTKGDLIDYYREIASVILPYLKDRPQSLNRHPNGIAKPGFFQKDMTGYLPRWVRTERIYSESTDKSIDYFLCQNEQSLLYLANLGCIELNPWLSRVKNLENPDLMVIDLDPDDNDFSEVVRVAHVVREVLEEVEVDAYCKTSGATGLHICAPTGGRLGYDAVRELAEALCREVHERIPALTSVERNPARRRKKIYLDFLQNRRGQTLAAPYCVRPRPGATVSTPLRWKELGPKLRPEQFTIRTILKRLERTGDLWVATLRGRLNIDAVRSKLAGMR